MKKINFILFTASLFVLSACSSDNDTIKDEEKPTITINYDGGFPQVCESLQRGETYTFRARLADNEALASYSLDLHHNFDHHTHDDQGATCSLDAKKESVKPFIYMENFSLDGARKEFEIEIKILIPTDIDTGDYHCSFSVTDEVGWQSRTSVDIKIVN
ncbi:DUF4625 domain-containing protein [Leeuwenhoekiella aequorea]|uniref:DUF4625 domain-containing protein n=1 Tax=Leeuwenhoekiella aequorea TaxID=283736 RepID=A0A4Q0P9N5_9FLAO|nr:DUF4625 domain-containing protein [Leeuwenhoekiella aequorea]RXG22539.1 putative protein DUF4625 [Leeuwenhoekiella aequorea]